MVFRVSPPRLTTPFYLKSRPPNNTMLRTPPLSLFLQSLVLFSLCISLQKQEGLSIFLKSWIPPFSFFSCTRGLFPSKVNPHQGPFVPFLLNSPLREAPPPLFRERGCSFCPCLSFKSVPLLLGIPPPETDLSLFSPLFFWFVVFLAGQFASSDHFHLGTLPSFARHS